MRKAGIWAAMVGIFLVCILVQLPLTAIAYVIAWPAKWLCHYTMALGEWTSGTHRRLRRELNIVRYK